MRINLIFFACLIAIAQAKSISKPHIELFSEQHVEYINSLNSTWKATNNFAGAKLEDLKGLCGTILRKRQIDDTGKKNKSDILELPDDFDSRQAWPECADVISHIRDQGSCGSCWAVATASEITDRICIASKGKKKTQISAQILTSCCEYCSPFAGCMGGYTESAYNYWVVSGLPTGGDYGDKETCAPYLVPPCEHHTTGSRPKCGEIVQTPQCSQSCSNEKIDMKTDLNFGASYRSIFPDVNLIKQEISQRGPVGAAFMVYDDFLLYKEGIYQVTQGASQVGGHAVVVIGWGKDKETGIEYWLAKNNWNTDWGENGYFKIKFGEAGIDYNMIGSFPA